MMRRALSMMVAMTFWVAPMPQAHALSFDDLEDPTVAYQETLDKLSADIELLADNTAFWLSKHLPAMMAQSGLGAGITLGDSGGGFSLGLIPVRVGFFNQFNQVAEGMEMLNFAEDSPTNLPWPQFGVTIGIGLGAGFEIGVDAQFIPDIDLALGDVLSVKVGILSAAASLRWRINDPVGPLPAFVIGVGGSYFHGYMELGAGHRSSFKTSVPISSPIDVDVPAGIEIPSDVDVEIEGSYSFTGSPHMSWDLYQICPEIRMAWEIGPFHPYLGLGLGITMGTVSGGASLEADVKIEKVGGVDFQGEEQEPFTQYDDNGHLEPSRFTVRPHVGFDIVLGAFAITAQVDLAVMTNQAQAGFANLDEAASNYDPDSEAARESTISTALVTTLAFRFQL